MCAVNSHNGKINPPSEQLSVQLKKKKVKKKVYKNGAASYNGHGVIRYWRKSNEITEGLNVVNIKLLHILKSE